MINVSFYLLNPDAKSKTLVYVSISQKGERLRFSTGHAFIGNYCNSRKTKGSKDLVKRNNPFYLEYNDILKTVRDNLLQIEFNLTKEKRCSLQNIRDAYFIHTGKRQDQTAKSFHNLFESFIAYSRSSWSAPTFQIVTNLQNHIKEFEQINGSIMLSNINEDLWNSLRDNFFAANKEFSNNTSNKYLKKFKQFIKYLIKKQLVENNIDITDFKYLEEIEPYKIALKEKEIVELIALDLSSKPELDIVRALFTLEVLTGQRFSDLTSIMEKKHISENSIQIYQQKTNSKVTIPLHQKLKNHLGKIITKHPEGIPVVSNQEFNKSIKIICKMAGFTMEHSWITQSRISKIKHTDFRYNLVSSHTGRRTFCTIALKSRISPELIMKVTGHKKYDQFKEYVKVDDDDLNEAFEGFMDGSKNLLTK